jgi:hypothetical protein
MFSKDRAVAMRYPAPFAFGAERGGRGGGGVPNDRFRAPPVSPRRDAFQGLGALALRDGRRYGGAYADVLRDPGHLNGFNGALRGRGYSDDLAAELRDHLARGRRDAGYERLGAVEPRIDSNRFRPARRPAVGVEEYFDRLRGVEHRGECSRCVPDCGHRWDRDRDRDHECSHKKKYCGCGNSDAKDKNEYSFKTKDVTMRGKSYSIRKNFLADLHKFENELVKFVDKKSEEEVPDHVVQMLVDFINKESCDSNTALDLVGLNILASNLRAKSAMEYSLQRLKDVEFDYPIRAAELTKICGTITMSGGVDEGLETWLRKFIQTNDALRILESSQSFHTLLSGNPEVWTRLEKIMGWRERENELGLMVM